MKILGLDTGSKKTGYVVFDTTKNAVLEHGDICNVELAAMIKNKKLFFDLVAGEMLEGRGNIAGNETYQAIYTLGYLTGISEKDYKLAYPRHIRACHAGRPNASDKDVKNGLLKKYRNVFRVHGEAKSEYSNLPLLQGDEIAALAVATFVAEKRLDN